MDLFITLVTNNCGCEGKARDFVVNWVHPLFLKSKYEASKEDNPNWNQTMIGPFADKYCQAACIELEIIEVMGSWDVVDREDEMNIIRSTRDFKIK